MRHSVEFLQYSWELQTQKLSVKTGKCMHNLPLSDTLEWRDPGQEEALFPKIESSSAKIP